MEKYGLTKDDYRYEFYSFEKFMKNLNDKGNKNFDYGNNFAIYGLKSI